MQGGFQQTDVQGWGFQGGLSDRKQLERVGAEPLLLREASNKQPGPHDYSSSELEG